MAVTTSPSMSAPKSGTERMMSSCRCIVMSRFITGHSSYRNSSERRSRYCFHEYSYRSRTRSCRRHELINSH